MKVVALGRRPHGEVLAAMRAFTEARGTATPDELWLVEHEPVYTLGLAGRAEHVVAPGAVPVVATNRGGQVTYHGPGQVVAYPLLDLRRAGLHVKTYVHRIEQAVLRMLERHGVTGHRVVGAPGVYVRAADPFGHARLPERAPGTPPSFEGLAKIAALGIKVHRHCAYHGVALNVAMDLAPFARIDPCGWRDLAVTDLRTLGLDLDPDDAARDLAAALVAQLEPVVATATDAR